MHRTLFYLAGVALILLLLVLLFSNSLVSFLTGGDSRQLNSREYTTELTPYNVLIDTNPAFGRAEAQFKQRNFEAAIMEYQSALTEAEDYTQEAQIKMKLGHVAGEQGNFEAAIVAYKEIADDARYPGIMRAYGVENMARLSYKYPFAAASIKAATFVGEPYQSFIADGASDALAYRRLHEYVLSFRELGYSAARVANWYALEAVRLRDAGKPVSEIQAVIKKTNEYIAMVKSDLPRIIADGNERSVAPEVLFRLGRSLAELSRVDGAALVDAEARFKQAYEIAVPSGAFADGFARFQYATFLEEFYGASRAKDIVKILAAFSDNRASYEQTAVFSTFRAAGKDDSSTHDRVVRLAQIDPNFKETLLSIGWEDTDFKVR